MEEDEICRVCRSSGSSDKPLFHPCMCTGSIRYVHQDCLLQWLHHSKKEHCELCNHKYTFKPIYSPDMPNSIPFYDVLFGLLGNIGSVITQWIFFSVVSFTWFLIVPIAASRIYSFIFDSLVSDLASFPKKMFSTNNLMNDIVFGYLVVFCTMSGFFILVWLKARILNGDLPDWVRHRPLNQLPQQNIHEINQNINFNNNEDFPNHLHDDDNALDDPENLIVWQGENLNDGNENLDQGEAQFWEKVLGRKGLLHFLKLVFWVIAVNTLFILVFAFFPYHLGHFIICCLNFNNFGSAAKFQGFLTTLCGYFLIACGFLFGHLVLQITMFHWPRWVCGVCYLIVKVALLAIIEIALFPLICGVWLDVCTLKAFNSTIQSRHEGYKKTPSISIFVHWFIGIVFMFYFALFLKLLREVLRPGILWFMRNLNDPNFSPLNEMIHLSMFQHFRQFLLTIVIFGFTIVTVAWLPVQLLLLFFPNIFPFSSSINSTSPLGEFPFQLLLLQLTVPGMLEQNNFKHWVKVVVTQWIGAIGNLLGLKSYLLGDNNSNILLENQWNAQWPYLKPSYFPIRLFVLMLFFTGTLAIAIAIMFSFPIVIGRTVMNFLFGNALSSLNQAHDIHAFLIGLHIFWTVARIYGVISTLIPRGWNSIKAKIVEFFIISSKLFILFILTVGLIPLLLGFLLDLMIVIPYKVPVHKSHVIVLLLDWIYGAFLLKFFIILLIIGPNTWLKQDFNRAHQQGLLRLPLFSFINNTIMPVIYGLLTFICAPYVFSQLIPLFWKCDLKTENFFKLQSHVYLISMSGFLSFCWYQINHIDRLYDQIKNQRYMIGRSLEDYEPTVAAT